MPDNLALMYIYICGENDDENCGCNKPAFILSNTKLVLILNSL